MKSATFRLVCRFLIASLLVLPLQGVQAGLIGADRASAAADSIDGRAAIRNFLNRTDVANQLRSMGVDPANALERVAAMTDGEVRALAGNIDSLPAGAANGWTSSLVVLIIGLVIYLNWK